MITNNYLITTMVYTLVIVRFKFQIFYLISKSRFILNFSEIYFRLYFPVVIILVDYM